MFTCDYHIHTNISQCAMENMEVEQIIRAQEERGMTEIGFADHCYGFRYRIKKVEDAKKKISQCETAIKVHFGVEAHMLQYRMPSIGIEFASLFDYVLMAPNHYHIPGVSRPDANKPRLIAIHELYMFEAAINCPLTDVIAHPFLFFPRVFGVTKEEMSNFSLEVMSHIDDKRLAAALDMVEDLDIGIELSPKFISFGQNHLIDFYQLCLEHQVKLFIGSGAHSFNELNKISLLEPIISKLGITEKHLWHPYEWKW
ncbi:TPA: PHP domain-containing protein [Candidatus Poribacteria bacterium]|nr:PHP domain-containing protein [Candidatus Poribacteria bacterium]